MRMTWRQLMVAAALGVMLAGCNANQKSNTTMPDNQARAGDPEARAFSGTIISLRPMVSTMLISKGERHGKEAYPNVIAVRYDADTKFFVDNEPATIIDLAQYMPVQVEGHMREGQMFAETARFTRLAPPPEGKSAKASE